MAQYKYLVIHCTATPEKRYVDGDDIKRWHMGPLDNPDGSVTYLGHKFPNRDALENSTIAGKLARKLHGRGWSRPGYSILVHLDGTKEQLMPWDDDNTIESNELTNGVLGFNSVARSICYVGGMDAITKKSKDTRTAEQNTALLDIVNDAIKHNHDVQIGGHNQFNQTSCPGFDVKQWLRDNGINEHNIYKP